MECSSFEMILFTYQSVSAFEKNTRTPIHLITKLVQLAIWKVANSATNMAQRAVKSLIAAMITPREWR